jgi:hypothetical protein
METVKKTYEEPTVQKVEFDFKTRIAASECPVPHDDDPYSGCNYGMF